MDRLPELRQYLASLGDGRDLRSDNEKAAYHASYNSTARCISNIPNLTADLARMTARVDEAQAKVTAWLAKEAEIEADIAAATDDQQRALKLRQRQLLHLGTLLVAPDTTLGSLAHLEVRVTELTERRDGIQQQLNTWTAVAEQLLSSVEVNS
jgi:hypothetical protein